MENPEKIEIEGLKTIHKLCKFGAEHNMEGCSFTEIVERMFVELVKAKADAVPEGFVLVPEECSDDMACKIAAIARVCGGIAGDIYEAVVNQAMIEAREQSHDGK